jgi:hypothetical protein
VLAQPLTASRPPHPTRAPRLQLPCLRGATHVLSFWQGMQAASKQALAALVNASPHVQVRCKRCPCAAGRRRSMEGSPGCSLLLRQRPSAACQHPPAAHNPPPPTQPPAHSPRGPPPPRLLHVPPQGLAIIQRGIWARREGRAARVQAHFEALGFRGLELVAQLGVRGEAAGSYQCFVLRRAAAGQQAAAGAEAAGGGPGADGAAEAAGAGAAVGADVWQQQYPRVRQGGGRGGGREGGREAGEGGRACRLTAIWRRRPHGRLGTRQPSP